MTRRRLYNPAQLTPEELKASFVAREDTLAAMLRLISEQPPDRPCQHMMLIGPRGMGKTTIGLRFLHEILDTPALAAIWQPVAFHEESYGIGNLADFWLAGLHHLTRAVEDEQWADRADALARDEENTKRLAAYSLAALMDFCQTSRKRLILFVENLDTVFKQLGDERQIHELRASLIERPEILLMGSANTVFEAIHSHGEPLYEFFRLFLLKGLGPEETQRILAALADCEGRPEVMETLGREHGRLETIRRLTGGNPRLLVLACRMLIDSPLGSAFEDLERLIDEQTPYFKARIEELPVQARKVFHCLAKSWKPLPAREVADAAKLSSSHASAQLRQLAEKGYAREVALPSVKRTLYEVGDRFYNIYYLLRFSRAGRERLARLVSFLHDLFGPTGMRTMYPATLDALRMGGSPAGETSDLLGILAEYVAKDEGFKGQGDWLRQALDLANDMMGPNAPVIGEIRAALASQSLSGSDRFSKLTKRGAKLVQTGRFADVEALDRTAIEGRPDEIDIRNLWLALGSAMILQKRYEDALYAFEQVLHHGSPHDTLWSRTVVLLALAGKAGVLLELKRFESVVTTVEEFQDDDAVEVARLRYIVVALYNIKGRALAELNRSEEAMEAWERVAEYVHIDDPPEPRHMAAKSLGAKGVTLIELNRLEDAIAIWERVAEYVHMDDPPYLRRMTVMSLCAKGETLAELNRSEEAIGAWERATEYVFVDDPPDLRQPVATLLAMESGLLDRMGKWAEAQAICERVTKIEPTHYESWRVLAQAILRQDDAGRLQAAEDYARRAVELAPDNSAASHTLCDVLARRGNWTDALNALERALHMGDDAFLNQERPAVTASLIQAVAAGHGPWVKRMMEKFGLIELMEPLWHAVRVELGETLEPLPAEIMDVVRDIRKEFVKRTVESDAPNHLLAKGAS